MKSCPQCNTGFPVTPEDLAFYQKVSPTFNGKTYPIPEPTLCPDCRLQRRMVWRNERSLYRRKCDKTGQPIISWIAPDKPHKVYKREIWWGDTWNALDYGRDFDFNRPFFEQLNELIQAVPWIDLALDNTVNSDYANFCNNIKDCYLIYASNNNESCLYCNSVWGCHNCFDCFQAFDCQLCYTSVDINNCYGTQYSKNCTNCNDVLFCENCQSCKNCFGCVNLVGKEYHFMNQPLSKTDYEAKIKNLQLDSWKRIGEARAFFEKHRLNFPMRFAQVINCENSTGDTLKDCKNTQESFDASGVEDSKWVFLGNGPIKDCYDVSGVEESELCYETVVNGIPSSRTAFSSYVWKNVHNVYYSVLCPTTSNSFGCVSLSKGEYCILNKKYDKKSYEVMVGRIVEHMEKTGEWGEFFPHNLSPFDYNETIAQSYFPMTEAEVKKRGWKWRPKEHHEYQKSTYTLPDRTSETQPNVTNAILACEHCGKNYKIIPQELKFYQNHQIPLPHHCSDCRLDALLKRRNPRRLWQRSCNKCQKPIQTTYAPERPEKVYCEECYLKEVY